MSKSTTVVATTTTPTVMRINAVTLSPKINVSSEAVPGRRVDGVVVALTAYVLGEFLNGT